MSESFPDTLREVDGGRDVGERCVYFATSMSRPAPSPEFFQTTDPGVLLRPISTRAARAARKYNAPLRPPATFSQPCGLQIS
jgi:hypothetical protein